MLKIKGREIKIKGEFMFITLKYMNMRYVESKGEGNKNKDNREIKIIGEFLFITLKYMKMR